MPEKTSLPGFSIVKSGREIPSEQIYSIAVEFGFSSIPKATLYINDGSLAQQNFAEAEKEEWKMGEKLEIKIGYNQQHETVFSGMIVKQSISGNDDGKSFLVIELKKECYKMSIKRSNRVFLDMKESDIFSEILNEYGIGAEVDDLANFQQQMISFNSSDWDFINLRAEANNMFVLPKNDKIYIKKKIPFAQEKITLKYGTNISKVNLETDGRNCFEEFSTSTWNPAEQTTDSSEPSESFSSTIGNIAATDIGATLKHGKKVFTTHETLEDQECSLISNWQMQSAENTKVRGTVKCSGTNDAFIGDWVKIEGLSMQFNGSGFITGVLHELSAGRWFTTYQLGLNQEKYAEQFSDISQTPAAGLLPAVSGLQIGIVQKIVSDSAEKILIKLPNVDESKDAVWARPARMDAGNNRGWVVRPEVGDEVIVGFINDDPRQAIILGSLHSDKNVAPIAAEEKNAKKGFISRENLELIFDDENKIIQISTPNALIEIDDEQKKTTIKNTANSVEMSDEGIILKSSKDVKIKADGNIEFEGTEIKVKAKGSLEMEGASGTKLSSSAVTNIKGSLVNINS